MSAERESDLQKSYALAIKSRREKYNSIREEAQQARRNNEDTSQLEKSAAALSLDIQYYMDQLTDMGLSKTEIEKLIELI